MKLNTLRDLEKGILVKNGVNETGKEFCKERFIPNLRAEAIKWIKYWEKTMYDLPTPEALSQYGSKIVAFKEFFNTKERDFKEKHEKPKKFETEAAGRKFEGKMSEKGFKLEAQERPEVTLKKVLKASKIEVLE